MRTKTFVVLFTSSLMLIGFIWGFANYTSLQKNGKLKDLYKEPVTTKKEVVNHDSLSLDDFSRKGIAVYEEPAPKLISQKQNSKNVAKEIKEETEELNFSSFSRAPLRLKKVAIPIIAVDTTVLVETINIDSAVSLVDTLIKMNK